MPYLGAVQLATTTLGSSASTVTFNNIPTKLNGLYLRDLILVAEYSTSNTGVAARLSLNSTSTTTGVYMLGSGSGSGSSGSFTDGSIGYSDTTNTQLVILNIFDYAATDKHKTSISRAGSGLLNAGNYVISYCNRHAITAAVSSLAIFISAGTFNANSVFSLYATVRKP